MKQKLKEYKGITLVTLIITIIVLLILAVVAISAVSGNGILNHAQNAKTKYSDAQTNEQARLDEYSEYLDMESSKINGGGVDGTTVKGSLNAVISTTDNTPLTDDFGNKIIVPAGFKILVDNTTSYTADDIDVTKGIVVEDTQAETAGNQFVWIPVGKIYTDKEKTEANAKTINLERNAFGNSNITLATVKFDKTKLSRLENNYTITSRAAGIGGSYSEGKKNDATENAHAKDIEAFISKTNANGGYYIGRYEARAGTTERKSETDALTPVTSRANDYVYNYVTQPQASERCQSMYTNKPYESDLINSYAWDTAIVFFQEFGDNSTYARKESVNRSFLNKGTVNETNKDVICNVYDMASNCLELSTETGGSGVDFPYIVRGGYCTNGANFCAGFRTSITGAALDDCSFRPVLYV